MGWGSPALRFKIWWGGEVNWDIDHWLTFVKVSGGRSWDANCRFIWILIATFTLVVIVSTLVIIVSTLVIILIINRGQRCCLRLHQTSSSAWKSLSSTYRGWSILPFSRILCFLCFVQTMSLFFLLFLREYISLYNKNRTIYPSTFYCFVFYSIQAEETFISCFGQSNKNRTD